MNSKILASRSDFHILRKLWHISIGSAFLCSYFILDISISIYGHIALTIAMLGFTLDFARLRDERFNDLIVKFLGPILRKSELVGFSGLPFYAMGAALSIYLYQEDIALISIFFLVFSDPIASLSGYFFGKEEILPNKTFAGTIGCFLSCYIIVHVYALGMVNTQGLSFVFFALGAALFGSLSELLSAFNIDDNITIPVVSGAGISLLNFFIPIF